MISGFCIVFTSFYVISQCILSYKLYFLFPPNEIFSYILTLLLFLFLNVFCKYNFPSPKLKAIILLQPPVVGPDFIEVT